MPTLIEQIRIAQRNAGENVCIQHLAALGLAPARAPEEPTFVLRAQDASAASVVEEWIYRNAGTLGEDHPKILSAQNVANEMRAWKHQKQAD